ncbi:unnamed protein product [Soboliphyme baturini]|uniref:Protein PHYLLO, chloroplastic n=1 Tax=Soboliphyme baturini TaxID=241478 RepID=A0A183IZC0_9BILA|nr:unnamed protein product [Soboliphyme baturini]
MIEDVTWLASELIKRKRCVHFSVPLETVVDYASRLLGPSLVLVDAHSDTDSGIDLSLYEDDHRSNDMTKSAWLKPMLALPDVLNLAHYANQVIPAFLLESVIALQFAARGFERNCQFFGQRRDSPPIARAT